MQYEDDTQSTLLSTRRDQRKQNINLGFLLLMTFLLLVLVAGFVYTNYRLIITQDHLFSITSQTLDNSYSQVDHLGAIQFNIETLSTRLLGPAIPPEIPESPEWTTKQMGQPGTLDYRIYFYKNNPISPWHDIPLWSAVGDENIVHMIVEIPRGTQAKMETNTNIPLNPILQDQNSGKLRYVLNPYPFNYGALPQTWENPFYPDPFLGVQGDSDPLDVIEIGENTHFVGEIITVKILGILGIIDNGADYKVIVVDVTDPQANLWNEISDLPYEKVHEVLEFLMFYKYPQMPNFAFEGNFQNRTFAENVVKYSNEQWSKLMSGTINNTNNGTVFETKCTVCPPGVEQEYVLTPTQAESILYNAWNDYVQNTQQKIST